MTKISLFSLIFALGGFVFTSNTYATSAYNPDAITSPTAASPTVTAPTVVAPDDTLSSTSVGIDYPDPTIYKIEFAENSPIKDVNLSKAIFQLQLFLGGNPSGIKSVIPTSNNTIHLKNPNNTISANKFYKIRTAINIRSITLDDTAPKNVSCRGFVLQEQKIIKVSCKK